MDAPFRHQATLISSERITPEVSEEEVRELVFEIDQNDFKLKPGQTIGVLAPPAPGSGEQHHARLYSIADLPSRGESGKARITICVRRCNLVDKLTGRETKGIASNYLCDLQPGDRISITGPSGLPFEVPKQLDANLILIGTGTGIAPFRAFVKHIYKNVPKWSGRIWLFYGAKSGLEMLYMNDEKDDFAKYYDRETFEAFKALSPTPNWADPLSWDQAFAERGQELWNLLADGKTYVYVAGLDSMRAGLDAVFASLAGNPDEWTRRKEDLVETGRWVELVY